MSGHWTIAGAANLSSILGLTALAQQSPNAVAIAGGTIDATAIGSTTAANGHFTTLSASGTATFASEPLVDVTQTGSTTALMPSTIGARALAQIIPGGTIAVSAGGAISWTNRMIVMNLGANAAFSANGYFDIIMPANGTVIPGYSNAASVTVASGAIVLPAWSTLYYILPIGAANTTTPANFAIMGYSTASILVPPNWVPICTMNDDEVSYHWCGGKYVLKEGDSLDCTQYRTGIYTAGNYSVGVNLYAGNALIVDGNALLDGNQLYTASGELYLQANNTTGGVSICANGGTTAVGGPMTLASTLSVSGASTLATLSVTGTSTLTGALYAAPYSSTNTLNVTSGYVTMVGAGGTISTNGNQLNGSAGLYLNYAVNSPTVLGFGGGLTTVSSGLTVTGGLTNIEASLAVTGTTTATSYFSSSANGAQFLAPGYMHYSDGSNYYLLLTGSGTPTATFNSLRPFYVSLSTGDVSMNNGLSVSGGTTTDSLTVSGGQIATSGAASSSYGAISISGSRNGYSGINFNDAGRTFMVENGANTCSGVYNSGGWEWLWTGGTLTEGVVPAANVGAGALTNGMTATTQASTDSSTNIATTAQVQAAIALALANGSGGQTGDIKFVAQSTPPTGWIKANGAAIPRTTYATLFGVIGTTYGTGDGSTTFNVPDLRGIFPRGFDDSRGMDPGRTLGSYQADQLQGHIHQVLTYVSTGGGSAASNAAAANSTATNTSGPVNDGTNGAPRTGLETRPKNIAFTGCIKY